MKPLTEKEQKKMNFNNHHYLMNKKEAVDYIARIRSALLLLPDHGISFSVYQLDCDLYSNSTKVTAYLNKKGEVYFIIKRNFHNEKIEIDAQADFFAKYYFAHTKESKKERTEKLKNALKIT
ncbi:hypothetical protein LMH73_004730 [Vibrio splendidus]|nr:hypothetical protein [Vibrio splendidus]MCC4882534.1 hypothetical protein [Vibrio splendidus]